MGQRLLPSGNRIPVSRQIDPACGALLQGAIGDVRPKAAAEVGLAFGISMLCMRESLVAAGTQKLIGGEPAQRHSTWRGGGLPNVERAGYRIDGLRNAHFPALRKRADDERCWDHFVHF